MIPYFAVAAGLLMQAASAPQPVRLWRADSIAYVQLREPGHVLLLSVDALGRIRVLFPFEPDYGTSVAGDTPFAVPLPPEAQGNPATLVAIRSRWPFDFAALRTGFTWNYYDAFLLQPTAGDPLAAVLDIAERVTDGRPYAYGVVTYSGEGAVVARGPVRQPDVCLSCVRRATGVAVVGAAIPSNSVDCSNASLTNSFCGVNSGSVSITSVPAAPPQPSYQPAAPAPVYVPYYLPLAVHRARPRFERPVSPPSASAPQPAAASAFPISPRLVVPSPAQVRTFARRPR
jgi:hypothetical protein